MIITSPCWLQNPVSVICIRTNVMKNLRHSQSLQGNSIIWQVHRKIQEQKINSPQWSNIATATDSYNVFKYSSNLDVFVHSAGQSRAVSCRNESRAVHRANGHREDGYRSQSITVQGCSADVGWGQRGGGTAHCHSSPAAALCRTVGRWRAHCEVWEIGDRCGRLDWCHCCCGPVLTVTCSWNWEIEQYHTFERCYW